MRLITEIALFLSASSLGLFAGALLTEAVVLVPLFRSLQPREFFVLHKAHAHRLYGFFAPLTATAASFALFAAAACIVSGHPNRVTAVVAATLTLVVLSTYFLYFRRANASFTAATIKPEDLAAELDRWASWHWFRTAVSVVSFLVASLSIRGVSG
jgi:Domain of unknown function (DUF1772)